ncbi:MAG: ABC transporter ATP-binding protein [Gammaproteobacteria bacterium]
MTREQNTPYRWNQFMAMVLSHRRELIIANVIAVLGALTAVPVPLLIPMLVDEVLLQQPGNAVDFMNRLFPESWHGPFLYIAAITLLTLVLRLFALIFGVLQTRQFTRISKDVIYRIRRSLLQRLGRISMSEYETMGSGTVASHLVTDLQSIDDFVSVSISKFVIAVLSIVGTAAVLLWMHWQLALFILLLNPLVIYVTTRFGRRVKQLKKRENAAFQLFQESLSETLDAIQQIRAANREKHYIARLTESAADVRNHSTRFAWQSDAATRLSFVVFLFGFDIFRALSMLMVLFSDLTIGEMLAVFAYLWFMMGPVQEVLGIQYAWHAAKAALNRINRLVDVPLEPVYPTLRNPFEGKHTVAIEMRDVSFSYGDGPLVLDHLSIRIPAGQRVALVGASGGGKTTFVQVLLGLYTPDAGKVLFDGVPVEEIGLSLVRDNIATVLQHPALLNDSIRLNLTLGRQADDAELWNALEIAQLRHTIEAMPGGLDTLVGNRGIRLSGGQRQRLAVARMVLTDPKIVILDEATSALDTVTESNLHDSMRSFLEGRTTIIVAHRLSAVRQAERVLVFEDGTIVEEGGHEELLGKEGLYASLYR